MAIASEQEFKAFLSALFDCQRFAPNPHLAAVLRSTENPSEQKLDKDALDLLSAAGTAYETPPKPE